MDGLEIAYRRLHNQHLSGPGATDPVTLVAALGAVQAQEYAVAKWSVGQRTTGVVDADLQRAIDEGSILRTHALRPTWHFVAAEDIGWLQALTGPRVHAVSAHYYRMHGLDGEHTAKTHQAIVNVLRGGNHLTRKELGQALAVERVEATGNRLAYVVMQAELDGLIANGPMRGKQHTYALIAERAPHARTMATDEALAELTRRYFTSHGPATVKDFAWWSSLTVTQIRRGLEMLGGELSSVEVEGLTYWFAPAGAPPRDLPPTAHVLQAYDEYVVAYTVSRPSSNLAGRTLGLLGDNLVVHPLLLDSQLAGYWRRLVQRDGLVAELTLAMRMNRRQRAAVDTAFARYASFAGVPVTVVWPDD